MWISYFTLKDHVKNAKKKPKKNIKKKNLKNPKKPNLWQKSGFLAQSVTCLSNDSLSGFNSEYSNIVVSVQYFVLSAFWIFAW